MARTIKVGLDVDEAPFVRGMGRATSSAEKFEDALDDVTDSAKGTTAVVGRAKDAADDLGDSAKDAGQDLSRLRADAARLDRQIDETTGSIRELARAIAATSDEAARADLSRKLTGEQGKLRQQVTLRKLIDVDSADDMGADLAQGVSVSFAAKLGPMLARAPLAGMNPAVLAIGAPLAAGLATLLATAAGGAIIGGVGIGGVVGGLKVAAKDPAVKAAGTALGEDIAEMLGRAAAPMTPQALGAIEQLRQAAREAEPDLRRIFAASAEYVPILTDGLTDAARNALPGFVDAVEAAEPVIEAVAEGARDLGDAVGDSLSDLSEYADEGARALSILLKMLEGTVRVTSDVIENASELYGVAEITGAFLSGDFTRAVSLVADRQREAAGGSRELGSGLEGVEGSARDAAREARDLYDVLFELNGLQLDANEAEREFQRAIDDAREAFDGKTRDFKGGTEKGREYGEALDNIAAKARDSAQAIFDQTGDVDAANAKIEEGRVALYNQARQYGRTDKEAREYVDSVLSIPKTWNTKVNLNADEALRDARAMRSVLQSLRDRNITIGVRWQSNGDLKVPGGTQLKNRWGGIYEHARDGLVSLREAKVFSPMGPARYAFAEPETGGEAFIPRYGNPDRSLAILNQAAGWYGARVAPASSTVVQGSTVHITIKGDLKSPQQIAREVAHEVAAIQGRQADILTR